MDKESKVQMTMRLPETLFDWSKDEAARIGIPQAALLLQLIDDGRRLRENLVSVLGAKLAHSDSRNPQYP